MLRQAARDQREIGGERAAEGGPAETSRVRRTAYLLSGALAIGMVVASAAGLLIGGLYPDDPWAREALRGGDLATLVVAAPVLVVSLASTIRGSIRAQAALVGALAYGIYNYAFYAFGAAFNDIFLLHVALLTLSIWATVLAVMSLDVRAVASEVRGGRAARWIGGFLVIVGAVLGGLWVTLAIRFAITGELMEHVPAEGVHLVFAVDLSLLVPALVVAGVLLWRRTVAGLLFGAVMAVMGALYQVNLLFAGMFQASAHVPGAKAFAPEGVVVAAGFGLACAVLFSGSVTADRRGRETRRPGTRGKE
jgi:hypothetical protein